MWTTGGSLGTWELPSPGPGEVQDALVDYYFLPMFRTWTYRVIGNKCSVFCWAGLRGDIRKKHYLEKTILFRELFFTLGPGIIRILGKKTASMDFGIVRVAGS